MSWKALILILIAVMVFAGSRFVRRWLVSLAMMAAIAVLVIWLLAGHGPS